MFKALADRTRRDMLDVLRDRPGLPVHALTERFAMSRIGALKHLRVLEAADLVHSERDADDARVRRLYLNAVPLQRIHERWTTRFTAQRAGGLLALERMLGDADAPTPPRPRGRTSAKPRRTP